MTGAESPFPEILAAFRRDPLSLLWRIPGVWPVDKPSGPSSNLLVVRGRKALGLKRVGHAGTLDPLASGLLLLLAGNATRLFDHMQAFHKGYRAGFRLGERTDSADITGQPIPGFQPACAGPLHRNRVEEALRAFRGDILQTPPMHSALKKDGQPLYKLARQGVTVERAARPVTVHRLALLDFDGREGVLDMDVSKGFYVRTLVDDLGLALGCGAVMTALRRTAIGPYRVEDAVGLEDMQALREGNSPPRTGGDGMAGYRFARAGMEDVPEIGRLMARADKDAPADHFATGDEDYLRNHVERKGFLLTARRDGELAGFLLVDRPETPGESLGADLGWADGDASDAAHMDMMVVDPAHRGRGLAGELLRRAETILMEETRTTALFATVHPENGASLRSLLRAGFQVGATMPKYGGKPRHVVFKRLRPAPRA